MARSTTIQKQITDALSIRVSDNETSLGQVNSAIQDNAQEILLLADENDAQDAEDLGIATLISNLTTTVNRLNRAFRVYKRQTGIDVDLRNTDYGFQKIIPVNANITVTLPATPDTDKFFAIINAGEDRKIYCNGVTIFPGDRYEIKWDATDSEWMTL